MFFGKKEILASEIGLKLAEEYKKRNPLSVFKKNIDLKITILEKDAFIVVLAVNVYVLSLCLGSKKYDNLIAEKMKQTIGDFFTPTVLMKNEIFECNFDDVNACLTKIAVIFEKLFRAGKENLDGQGNLNFIFPAKEVLKLLNQDKNVPITSNALLISEFIFNDMIYFDDFLTNVTKRFTVVNETAS